MRKQDTARQFRENLIQAMQWVGVNKTQLAEGSGIDRSTLIQLLNSKDPRLPNGFSLAQIASTLGVSCDWLLGISDEPRTVTTFLDGALNFTPESRRAPIDTNLELWRHEASGYKIRHVPTTFPELLKTQAVLYHEYGDYVVKTGDQAIKDRDSQQDHARTSNNDFEICLPVQALQQFAKGEGVWENLPLATRKEQLEYMVKMLDEFYPKVRLYGFDQRNHYSIPFTVFGPIRAVMYIGQGYFVLNTNNHIRYMIDHFDALIRNAVLQAHEVSSYLTELNEKL